MSTPYQRIEGYEKVLHAFGYWPDFHDSEVRSLLLDRNSVLFQDIADARIDVCLHAFEWTRGPQPTFDHHLVEFRFHDVHELTLDGFNHQNAILHFRIEDHVRRADVPDGLKLTFIPAHGLSGSFCATGAEVLSVIRCDENARSRKAEPSDPPNDGLGTPVRDSDPPGGGRHR